MNIPPVLISPQCARRHQPLVDTDVLVWPRGDFTARVGAYLGRDEEGPIWVGTQGERLGEVSHWAHLPVCVL